MVMALDVNLHMIKQTIRFKDNCIYEYKTICKDPCHGDGVVAVDNRQLCGESGSEMGFEEPDNRRREGDAGDGGDTLFETP